MYRNEIPLFEIVFGASMGLAACLLIFPGFVTDALDFSLIPWTRNIIIGSFLEKKNMSKKNENYIEGEIIKEDKKRGHDDV